MPEAAQIQNDPDFSPTERDAVYRCIHTRRDVRGQFLPDPIPDEVLAASSRRPTTRPASASCSRGTSSWCVTVG